MLSCFFPRKVFIILRVFIGVAYPAQSSRAPSAPQPCVPSGDFVGRCGFMMLLGPENTVLNIQFPKACRCILAPANTLFSPADIMTRAWFAGAL